MFLDSLENEDGGETRDLAAIQDSVIQQDANLCTTTGAQGNDDEAIKLPVDNYEPIDPNGEKKYHYTISVVVLQNNYCINV